MCIRDSRPSFHSAAFCHGDQGDGYQSAIGYGERGDSGGCAHSDRKEVGNIAALNPPYLAR